jgi:Protein of unknown function (DUF3551)
MKLLLLMLGISVGIVGVENRAEAQNYPWCAMLSMGDQAINCGFVSYAQCMATVSGVGGYCTPNNTYQPIPELRPQTRLLHRYSY